MKLTPSMQTSVLTAVVLGAGSTAAYASANLDAAQVIQSDGNGFEATIALKDQPTDSIASIALKDRQAIGVDANNTPATDINSLLKLSVAKDVDGSGVNHLIKLTGPAEAGAEMLSFNVEVQRTDGSSLVRGYEIAPMILPSPEALLAMAEFQEVEDVAYNTVEDPNLTATTANAPSTVAAPKAQTKTAKAAVTPVGKSLAVGDVKVHSAMGEKLAFEFDVTGKNIKNAQDIRVQVLPDLSLGVVSPEVATEIATMQHNVVKKGNGRYSVQLTSIEPMNEPLLPIMVEVMAGGDVENRHYSVLVDPPKMMDPIHQTDHSYFVQDTTPKRKQAVASSKRRNLNTGSYTVAQGDTLSSIAAQIKAKAPLSEKMRYLRDSNPHAFIDGNINKIIAGTTLNFPSSWKVLDHYVAPTQTAVNNDSSRVETLAQKTVEQDVPVLENVAQLEEDQLIGDEMPPVTEMTEQQAQTMAQEAPVVAKEAVAQPPVAVTPPVPVEQDSSLLALVDDTNTLAVGGGALGLAMAAGGVVLLRRRKQKQEQMFENDAQTQMAQNGQDELSFLDEEAVSLDTIDYIAEADALVAHGQVEQALSLLKEAIIEDKSRTDVVLKLFEVLTIKDDSAVFDRVAVSLHSALQDNPSLYQQVNALAQKMTPVPDYFVHENGTDSLLNEVSV
ncbi:type IV pilus assembly protein FimV [Neisseria sp. Ec49-e6-T10]|uniref:type IV pilus assembly protein FimV n=1 Tax=Neisseria sp. Ec49-e6-T10 TaxID=3140744 RepID=UPI003EB893AE